MKRLLILSALCMWQLVALGQLGVSNRNFTRQDSLRGSITPERAWWDLLHYNLYARVNPKDRTIKGSNAIRYKVLKPGQVLQIDLQKPLELSAATQDGQSLTFKREGNVYWVSLAKVQKPGAVETIELQYWGKPRTAKNAPWDGGFSWAKDKAGNAFVATSCQGLGSSVWWPCKDHMYDEPDSMAITISVPEGLTDVSNGRLVATTPEEPGWAAHKWVVKNPINNYGVNVNIAPYTSWTETYKGENGPLDLSYYVLPENLDKAKEQFKQVPLMLAAFEHWFGPYPFYEDGYKLVEVPYLGMEHQSSVTYGNKYKNGYLGRDLSGTGWGEKWDFIIIHESGHEWFANNVTYQDIADMWVHEGFTAYSEALYTEYHFGKEAGYQYIKGTRKGFQNDKPIIGPYGVNEEGSQDMYPKAANMLHMLRQYATSDEKWRAVLRGINKDFYHQVVTSAQIETYLQKCLKTPLKKIFDQYLRDPRIPVLETETRDGKTYYRFTNCIEGFELKMRFEQNGKNSWETIGQNWKAAKGIPSDDFLFDTN